MSPVQSSRRSAVALFITTFATLWGLITHGTYAGSGDEPHYLMIARSLAFDADVDLANDYADAGNLIGGGTLDPGGHARPGPDGVLRPVHDIGWPLLAAPVVAVAYTVAERVGAVVPAPWLERFRLNTPLVLRHQVSLLMAIVAGFLTIELWRFLLMTGATPRHAFWWALLGVLSPPLLSHAFLFFTEIPSALVVLVVLRRLIAGAKTPASALLTGLLIGLLCLVHVRNAPIALALGVVAIAGHGARNTREWWRIGQIAAGAAAMLALRTAVHTHFWGTLLFDEHARLGGFESLGAAVSQVFERATGMLFDQEFGLLVYAPIYLLAPAGMVVAWHRAPRIGRPLVGVCAAYIAALVLPIVNPYGWQGGFSPAARFLVPVAPLLIVAASFCARAVAGRARLFVRLLIALQLAIDAVVWQAPKRLWNDADGVSALADAMPSAWRDSWTVLPSWLAPEPRVWAFWTASALLVALAAWLLRECRDMPQIRES